LIKSKPEKMSQLTSINATATFRKAFNTNLASTIKNQFNDFDRKMIEANILAMNSKTNEDLQNRWSIGVQASPVYRFDQISESNSDEANYDYGISQTNSTSYQANLSGGLKLAYKANKKWSIETGIQYSEIDQNASDIYLAYGEQEQYQMDNLDIDNSIESTTATTINDVIVNTQLGWSNLTFTSDMPLASERALSPSISVATDNYELNQKVGYVEIPLIFHYSLIDKRIGINLSGGLSTNVLISNIVSLSSQDETIANGTTEGLRSFVYSSSLGIGMNYAFSKRFYINFEPTLKIQINSLNYQSGFDARPYAFGIYSGINYHF
jgi:hypothetical protein